MRPGHTTDVHYIKFRSKAITHIVHLLPNFIPPPPQTPPRTPSRDPYPREKKYNFTVWRMRHKNARAQTDTSRALSWKPNRIITHTGKEEGGGNVLLKIQLGIVWPTFDNVSYSSLHNRMYDEWEKTFRICVYFVLKFMSFLSVCLVMSICLPVFFFCLIRE